MNKAPIVRDVCLVGGGHSHVLLIRRWAMQPIPGVRLTLISSQVQTPYSGMLPGLIAGHYSYDEIHIDLLRLCAWADVRFVEDTVTGIELENRQVMFSQRPGISFDVLSLDTGSTPDLSVPGSAQYVTPVKPVSNFHERWASLQHRLNHQQHNAFSIGVVGSGAGGFELITAIAYRLRKTPARCYWFLRGERAISGRTMSVGRQAIAAAQGMGIEVVRHADVTQVKPGKLLFADGRTVELDEIVWCTAATGPAWPRQAGLDTDNRGFVATNEYLQSCSHPFVFASGDIGTQVQTPSNKAGVFAVRQAPVLFENIRRFLLDRSLKRYRPQKDFLSLMATGPQYAIASRGALQVNGHWVWRWKNRIDQRFMDRFRTLPGRVMNASLDKLPDALNESVTTDHAANPMRCRGCGAKVGNDVLQRVLDDLLVTQRFSNQAATLWSPAGDTAVITLPDNTLVQSVDHINAIVDDPYLLGKIAALHAISDVVTLDASVHSAQVLLTVEEASEQVVERDLRQLMSGLLSVLNEESCALAGGHTTQGLDMSVGLTVNATMRDGAVAAPRHCVVNPGDAVILTKPLGVGCLFAGQMQGRARGVDVMAAVNSMLRGNRIAADILRQHGCAGMTDVTGFGLIGHLLRLLDGLGLEHDEESGRQLKPGVSLGLSSIALLPGALALSREGCKSSLWPQNAQALSALMLDEQCDSAHTALLADPQTSGGLLAVVPATATSACLEALTMSGYSQASCIGIIEPANHFKLIPSLDLP